MLNVNQTSRALDAMENAKRIACMCHSNPDGDALGAMLGLTIILERKFPQKKILRLCRDQAPETFHFLHGAMKIREAYSPTEGDVLFFLDAAEPKLLGPEEEFGRLCDADEMSRMGITTIKVDHHATGVPFAHMEFVDSEAASSCEIVVDLADALDLMISADAATALLTGIYTDTGSMMHSNTSSRVYRTAARLIRAGADNRKIVEQVYRTSKPSTMKLWGRVLEKISLSSEGGAVSAVTAGDFRAAGADFSELTGAIDYVNSIPGMRFSLILSERDGKVKGSLRTLRDDVDVSAMAQKFSGGGHRKAAGFSIPGKLETETRWKVVPPKEGASKE
jgi:bifunctional oligoribonuclease and PAP phosphatase NrnA